MKNRLKLILKKRYDISNLSQKGERNGVFMDRRIAYAIPNIFTAASLICALVALNQAAEGYFIQAAWLVTLSLILDGFDGRMARMLNATSKIGAQADSLADFVAFGVVPGFLAWQVSLRHFGFIGFSIFIVYVLCGGFRLARYNVMTTSSAIKSDFMGLPIPAAAAAVCSFILFSELVLSNSVNISQSSLSLRENISIQFTLLMIMAFVSFLMVSKIPYIAVNKKQKKKKYLSLIIVFITVLAVLAIRFTVWVYLISAWLYIIYGLYNMTKLAIIKHHERQIYKKTRKVTKI